jgi:hypothetical protein
MSWSLSFDFENGEPQGDAAEKLSVIEPPHRDQAEEAVRSVFQLAASGVVGDPNGKYKVTLSGHGNPDHKPAPGWGNDFVTISVYQQ